MSKKYPTKYMRHIESVDQQYKFMNDNHEIARDIVDCYTAESYLDFEGALQMLRLFESVPVIVTPIVVYRGLEGIRQEDLQTEMSSFMSATLLKEVAYDFARNGVMLEITVPSGSSILPLMNYSCFPEQCEILINGFDSKLQVTEHTTITAGDYGVTLVNDRFENKTSKVNPHERIHLVRCVLTKRNLSSIDLRKELAERYPPGEDE